MRQTRIELVDLLEACRTRDPQWLRLAYGIDPATLAELNSVLKGPTAVSQGASLCPQGRHCDALYIVHSGAFKCHLTGDDGYIQITSFLFSGELIGIDALYDHTDHATATALVPSWVFRLPTEQLGDITARVDGLRRELFRLISRQIREDERHVLLMGRKPAEARVSLFFLHLNHRQHNADNPGLLYLPMSRDDLANYLATTPETLSRTLTHLAEDGLIEIPDRRHVLLRDLAQLGERAGVNGG